MVQDLYMYNDRPTVVAHNLSNGAIFNDFDQALTHMSSSWHYLTLSVLDSYISILIGLTQPTQRELPRSIGYTDWQQRPLETDEASVTLKHCSTR